MMRGPVFLMISFLSLMASTALAQQEIILMTGKVIKGAVTSSDSVNLYYDFTKRSGKAKAKKLELERVFSINGPSGEERVVYYMDTAVGNYFTVDEMRFYIKGEQDALAYFKSNITITAGLPITAGLGYVLSGTIFAFAVPFAYLVGTGMPKYKIPKDKIDAPNLITEPAYVLGFERTARNKRLFKALATGLVGTAIGFAAGQIAPINP